MLNLMFNVQYDEYLCFVYAFIIIRLNIQIQTYKIFIYKRSFEIRFRNKISSEINLLYTIIFV